MIFKNIFSDSEILKYTLGSQVVKYA